MKIEEAAKAHSHKGQYGVWKENAETSFIAGANFITDRAYDKERIQRLISHIYEATGHTPLESDMHEVIHILTSEQYE